jgi:LppP/LprE lipoprotein
MRRIIMLSSSRAFVGVALVMCGASMLFAQAQTKPPKTPTSWLDAPLTNWNATLTAIPRARIDKSAEPMDPRCKDTQRSGSSAEDKLLTSAGWTLFGQEQQLDDVALVTALTSVDGMCRPLGYQAFVFVDGKFAGTISPVPMDSRSDGSTGPIHLTSTSTITVGFSRYKPSDALCCPSRRQIVTYSIDRAGARPLLVPRTVTPLTK